MNTNLNDVLQERGNKYGSFDSHAEITQALKRFFRGEPVALPEHIRTVMLKKWAELSADQQEALDMQAHKDGRIFNGDHNYADSWVDKAGYNKLVSDRLLAQEEAREPRFHTSVASVPFSGPGLRQMSRVMRTAPVTVKSKKKR